MQIHPQQMRSPMTRKPAPRAQAHSGVALFIATLTILIALVAFAPLTGAGQLSGQPPHPGSRLQATGSTSGSSQPTSPLFLPAVTYVSGGFGATSIAISDVNGDGKLDLVVANEGSSAVAVLLGNGDGSFRPAVSYVPGGIFTESVAVADMNGDGKPDLLVASRCASSTGDCSGLVGVLLGNGDGTFQPAVTYGSGGQGADSVAVADVNGDGKPDLLVANECGVIGPYCPENDNGVIGVLLGNGDGTFQAAVTYDSGGGSTRSLAAADVNGDGKPDLLVANCGRGGCAASNLGVLLGNGNGTFQPAVSYSTGCCNSLSVAVRDVNGDGKPDLLVANACSIFQFTCTGPGTVGVLLGNGDGTFQAAVTYGSGGLGTFSVAAADVNGDGKPDLLVTNLCALPNCTNGRVEVLLGFGDGTFLPAVGYSSGGYDARFVAVADVNGDGKPDLVVANSSSNNIGVLLNNTGIHNPTSTSMTSSLNPSIYGKKVTWTATVTSSGSFTPTGKVQFKWSGYTIGSATLNSSGAATLTRSNLNADAYPLTAVYAGDADNLASTSAVLTQLVLETTSAATLTSSPNPSTQGQAVTFAAKISSPTVIPTGPVTFTSGKTVLGTAQLSGGKAKLEISSLAVGLTKVTVTYYGDSNIAKSSASVIQTVQ
jgi:hypothetical protein